MQTVRCGLFVLTFHCALTSTHFSCSPTVGHFSRLELAPMSSVDDLPNATYAENARRRARLWWMFSVLPSPFFLYRANMGASAASLFCERPGASGCWHSVRIAAPCLLRVCTANPMFPGCGSQRLFATWREDNKLLREIPFWRYKDAIVGASVTSRSSTCLIRETVESQKDAGVCPYGHHLYHR